MRLKKKSRSSSAAIRIVVLTGILMLSLIGCKSPTSPGGAGEADIIVSNNNTETLDVYLDGVFKFSSKYKSSLEIDNVPLGEHQLEARTQDTGTIYDSTSIDVTENVDYTWNIVDPPDINVVNQREDTLKIYMDGKHQFDLVFEENRWILDVSYGERFLKAVRASDGKEIAAVTIKIDRNADFTWTIN
jgi:hypothetical protein